VVTNGLTNAVKYGGRGGAPAGEAVAIQLSARMAAPASGPGGEPQLEVEVLDGGRGLGGRTLAELSREFAVLSPMATGGSSFPYPTAASTQPQPQLQSPMSAAASAASAFSNVSSAAWASDVCCVCVCVFVCVCVCVRARDV
jgi:hypothetical protein